MEPVAMSEDDSADLGRLGRQSLRRPLSEAEARLAEALEQIFARGCHEFAAVAAALQELKVRRPSGSKEPWTLEALEAELKQINVSLDDAYLRNRSTSR
jgi:recombinase-like protein